MTDQVGVRFGAGSGVLFVLTDVVVVGRLPGMYGVALLLVATAVLAAALYGPYALMLGLAGWAFATGFAAGNALGGSLVHGVGTDRAFLVAAGGVAAAALLGRARRPVLAGAPAGMRETPQGLGRTG